MRVNGKFLEKYYRGLCTKAEKEEVEKWLISETFEGNEFLELPKDESKDLHKQLMWKNITKHIYETEIKVVPLYRNIIRYVAVACVAIVFFMAGRFSNTVANTPAPADNLLVYGGNGAHAKVQGKEFNLQFDGRLKLYNGSEEVKTVTVGNKTYSLSPMKTYMLMGGNENSSFIAINDISGEKNILGYLKGDFSVRVLKA